MAFWEFLGALPFWALLVLAVGVYAAGHAAVDYWYYVAPATVAAVAVGVPLYQRRQALLVAYAQELRPSLGPKEAVEAYQWDLWLAQRRRRPDRAMRLAVYNRATTVDNLQVLCGQCNQRKGKNL